MRAKFLTLLMAAALLCGAHSASATIHHVTVGNSFFSPLGTTVQPGDTVRWTWDGGVPHSTTSEISSPKSWNSGVTSAAGFTYDVVFTASDPVGAYPYLCSVHAASMKDTIWLAAAPAPTVYTFRLDRQQPDNCNGAVTDAIGYCMAILSEDSSDVSFTIIHTVDTSYAVVIHTGAPCVTGPAVFSFTSTVSPIKETWALGPAELASLVSGQLYIDVHSADNPPGELRGQIVQEPLKFIFTLDEAQANAGLGTGSHHAGIAVCELNAMSSELSIDVRHDADMVTSGHIHDAPAGSNGGVAFAFSSAVSPIVETWMVDTTDIEKLISGNLYVNIHTTIEPAGEIRGQITNPELYFGFYLDETQANAGAGTGSSATGFGLAILSPDRTEFDIHIEHNVTDPIASHVHLGAAGVSGPAQFGFASAVSPINGIWQLNAADLDDFLSDGLYANVHSTAFPSGEIRGQIEFGIMHEWNFELNEAQANECAGTGSSATGQCTVQLKPGGRELTLNMTHDVVDPTIGHIHSAEACVSGDAVVSFSSAVSPISEIWYLHVYDIPLLLSGNYYANVHSTTFPAEEIRGQIDSVPPVLTCCTGPSVGNVDGSPDNVVTLGDLTILIDHLFITLTPLVCDVEGNVDMSVDGLVTLGDLTVMIDHLFITLSPLSACP